MPNISKTISINGWVNVDDALIAAVPAYQPGRSRTCRITNLSATACTVHPTDSGTQPSTAADGIPVGAGAVTTAIGNSVELKDIDVDGLWINTPSALNITISIIGL